MNFGFSEEQDLLRREARKLLDEQCPMKEVRRLGETPEAYSSELWKQLAELGFQLILYPLTGLFGAAAAMHQLCTKLMADGTSAGAEDQLMDFASFNELIGVEERLELVRRLQEVEE